MNIPIQVCIQLKMNDRVGVLDGFGFAQPLISPSWS